MRMGLGKGVRWTITQGMRALFQSFSALAENRSWLRHSLIGAVLLSCTLWGYAVPLPQNHPYQVTLRNYLASLIESDFIITPATLSYDTNFFASVDNLYRIWLLTGFYSSPRTDGLRYPASRFTLSAIEGDANSVLQPYPWAHEIAWWAQWSYPGNPFYGSRAIKLRAFASAVVDMIMLDDAHERGLYRRSDLLGGTLIWLGYTYGVVKDILPAEVREAYETGLIKFFTRIEQWGPTGMFGDMDSMAIVGMFYTAQSIGDPDLLSRAQNYASRIIMNYFAEGMERHQGGYDASYNGIAIFFLTWAALATNWEITTQAVDWLHEVKSHLTLPEPDGTFYGPSHFSSNTSADVANDQWSGTPPRDIGAAMVSDWALYLAFGGRTGRAWAWAVPDPSRMESTIRSWMNSINNALGSPLSPAPSAWVERHWIRSETNTYASDHYRPGTYARLQQILQSNSPLSRPPFSRSGTFINHLLDTRTFLAAKFTRYGAILYTGRLSWQANPIAGFGGGLSAFWTPETGSVILGRRRGFQHNNPDRWDEWRTWPVNALSGALPDGRAFTTARYRPSWDDRGYTLSENGAFVVFNGRIGDAYTAQNNAIQGTVTFRRTFTLDAQKVTIESALFSDSVDTVAELYESIPLFLYESVRQRNVPHQIWFLIGNQWVAIDSTDTSLHEGVQQVKIRRFNGRVRIVFDTPRSVKLSEQWYDGYQSGATCRNILVDLLENAGQPIPLPTQVVFRYQILPLLPGDIDGDGCINDTDLLMVLWNFGTTGNSVADIDENGLVDENDLLTVLLGFGSGC